MTSCESTAHCPQGHFCGYAPPNSGNTVLMYDKSSPGICYPMSQEKPGFNPPCTSSDACPGGTCLQLFPQENGRRCVLNMSFDHSSSTLNAVGASPLFTPPWYWVPSYLPSSACADIVMTNFAYTSGGNAVCWSILEDLAAGTSADIAAISLAAFGPFGVLGATAGFFAEQAFLYALWNSTDAFQKCSDVIDGATHDPVMSPKSQAILYNNALNMCEQSPFWFKPSERKPIPDSSLPPEPSDPCAGKQETSVCVSGKVQGTCQHLSGSGHLACLPPPQYPDPCEGKKRGDACVNAYAGTCQPIGESGHGVPSPTGNVCMPLDLPLCSSLRNVASPPHGCEDRPYYFESLMSPDRKACALLKNQILPPQKAWQCHSPTGTCPTGTLPCYWDGNWA